jgi:hypothetical protein
MEVKTGSWFGKGMVATESITLINEHEGCTKQLLGRKLLTTEDGQKPWRNSEEIEELAWERGQERRTIQSWA